MKYVSEPQWFIVIKTRPFGQTLRSKLRFNSKESARKWATKHGGRAIKLS